MSTAASAAATATKNESDVDSPPKPPSLVLLSSADFEAAAQMCEHEWLAHASSEASEAGGEERRGDKKGETEAKTKKRNDDDETIAPPKPPPPPPPPPVAAAVAPSATLHSTAAAGAPEPHGANLAASTAPREPEQPQFAERSGAAATIDRDGASSPLPSTPSASEDDDDDDEGLDVVPDWRRRSGAAASSRLPLTSPAISDGGGLRDEHVEDSWSESECESEESDDGDDGGGGNEGDNERSASGTNGTPQHAAGPRGRKARKQLVGGGGGVRRALLPPASSLSSRLPGGGGGNGDDKKNKKTRKERRSHRRQNQQRSLRAPGRHFTVVTTASLPWMTGTSVNPTLRSAYLARALPRSSVTLLLPWLPASQQAYVFPKGVAFESPREQEEHVREWIRQRTGFDPPGLRITWYHARYCPVMKSIFPYGDLTRLVGGGSEGGQASSSSSSSSPSHHHKRDVAILEEPEHLTWFHSGPRWTSAFERAIGVAHTNYGDYVAALRGRAAGALVAAANRALVAVHTDAVIRLSDALPALPRARTAFVHGVARGFITAGRGAKPGRGAYYVGKALWAKGYSELVALLGPDPGWAEAARLAREAPALPGSVAEDWGPADEGVEDLPKVGGEEGGEILPPSVDAFGSGEDADAVRAAAAAGRVPLTLRPGRDHLDPTLRSYRVFVNPSTSDVVATTSAEALALGRWLVCPIHPCNEFFSTFRACLRYGDAAGFRAQLCRALSRPPPRLSAEERASLTWAAATRRFLDAVEAPAERQRAQNARRRGIFLSASTASLAGGSSAAGGSSSSSEDDESDDEERRFPPTALGNPPPTALRNLPPPPPTTTAAPPAAPPPQPSKLSRLSAAARGAAAGAAESLTHRLYGLAMRVEAARRLFGAGAFTRVAPALPCGACDHALEARRPCHERAHEAQGYRRSRYVGGRG